MKKTGLILLATLIITTVFSVGCSVSKDAEKVAISYYEAIQRQDFDEAVELYSEEFFKETTEAKLREFLEKVATKLGELESYSLAGWKTTRFMGSGEKSGTYYVLQYETEYSKYPARETLTLFKPASSDEILIYGFNINSSGFLE